MLSQCQQTEASAMSVPSVKNRNPKGGEWHRDCSPGGNSRKSEAISCAFAPSNDQRGADPELAMYWLTRFTATARRSTISITSIVGNDDGIDFMAVGFMAE